jgi:FMN phosphatase YigB (HAD superfamily)
VFSGRPVDAVARVGEEHGIDPDELFTAIFGPYHLDGDHVWHRLERGEIALADAWAQVQAAVDGFGLDFPLVDFFRSFGADETDRSIVTETLLELHGEGATMAIVTNNVREFSDMGGGGWRSLVPIDAISLVVDSSAVGMRKPDPAIYHHVLGELGVEPEVAVFVDDMPANVDTARAVGMHGVLFGADPIVAMADLRAVIAAAGGLAVSSR